MIGQDQGADQERSELQSPLNEFPDIFRDNSANLGLMPFAIPLTRAWQSPSRRHPINLANASSFSRVENCTARWSKAAFGPRQARG